MRSFKDLKIAVAGIWYVGLSAAIFCGAGLSSNSW